MCSRKHTHTNTLFKIQVFGFVGFGACLIDIHVSKYFIFLHLIYIMYTNPYSMLLNHIAIQNYFKNYSKFKNFPIKNTVSGQRSTGRSTASISGLIGRPHQSTGPCGIGMHICARLPVDRTGWPTDRPLLSGFVGRPGRSTDRSNYSFWLACGRPSPMALLPDRLPVDRPGWPTAASSPQRLVSWNLFSGFDFDGSFSYFWFSCAYYLTY